MHVPGLALRHQRVDFVLQYLEARPTTRHGEFLTNNRKGVVAVFMLSSQSALAIRSAGLVFLPSSSAFWLRWSSVIERESIFFTATKPV